MNNTNASRIALASFCLAAFASVPAWALHKCTTKEGKVIYTEFECEKDATASGVPIHDSAGVDSKGKGPPASSASSKGPRSMTSTKTTTLPPMPTMGPPPQRSPLMENPNRGVRQHAEYVYDQENKARREKYDQEMKEWREKAAATK